MTDRVSGCTVIFDRDIREDDAQGILDAIARLRNVATVEPRVVTHDRTWAFLEAQTRLRNRVIAAFEAGDYHSMTHLNDLADEMEQ